MKYFISFLFICVLSFVLIYSCSAEEEGSVAPVVQTPQPGPEPVEYTLTVSAAEGGTEVTITATANEGYRFTGWEGNTSTEESLTIILNSNQTYQALFELIPIYTLTVATSEGGIVSTEGGEYQEGTEIELIATPNEGYRFDGWEGIDSNEKTLKIVTDFFGLYGPIEIWSVGRYSTSSERRELESIFCERRSTRKNYQNRHTDYDNCISLNELEFLQYSGIYGHRNGGFHIMYHRNDWDWGDGINSNYRHWNIQTLTHEYFI